MDMRYFDKAIVSEHPDLAASVGRQGFYGEVDQSMFVGFSYDGDSEVAQRLLARNKRSGSALSMRRNRRRVSSVSSGGMLFTDN